MYIENSILDKALKFASRVIKLYQSLVNEKREPIVSEQMIESATSIGIIINAAETAVNKDDFAKRMNEALDKAAEAEYWLRLLVMTGYVSQVLGKSMLEDCLEIQQLLTDFIKSVVYKGQYDGSGEDGELML